MSCLTLLRTLHLLGSQLTPRGEKQNNNMKTTNDSSTLLLQVTLVSLSNPIMMRDVRDYLTSSEVDRTHVALNVCRCCHVEIEPVFATWGLSLIKNGRFEEAREKFQGCLKNAKEKQHAVELRCQLHHASIAEKRNVEKIKAERVHVSRREKLLR